MDMTNLLDTISKMKRHGDAVRIAAIVNDQRANKKIKNISPSTVRSMLNKNRSMTEEVAAVASLYFEQQQELKKKAFA